MGLHAETLQSCRVYTLLLMGCVSHSWKLTWQSPVLYILLFSSYLFPIFPPKKKSDVEKAESARAELDEFIRVHGEIPSQLSDLSQSRAIYSKLKRLKLLHLLKQEDSHVAICKATDTFFQKHSRLPNRQNRDTDERRAEDALAQRWDRLLAQRASLGDALLTTYERLFMAADMEDASVVVNTCAAVEEFFDRKQRLPMRQNPATDEQRAEDALAQRWDRLLAQRASLGDALLTTYERLFMAADMEDASVVVDTCAAVEEFFDRKQRLPMRQNPATDEQRAEDALAQRWDRLLAQRASLGDALLTTYERLFMAADMEDASVVVNTCAAVEEFFDRKQRLPMRQNPATDEQRAEDALAQRWDRLLAQRASLGDALLTTYERLFTAADMEDASVVVDTCAAVEEFFDRKQRLPMRQNPATDEQRAEDALAQRWDRLLAQRASLGDALLTTYERLFMAADMEDASVVVDTCAAVEEFFDRKQRLPMRQNPATDEQRAEDALAQRWDRLLAQRASLGDALLTTYERLFMAADMEDASVVVDTCAAVQEFFDRKQRLPTRQNPATDEQRAEDALAQRWDRLLAQRASLGDALLTTYERLFLAADMEDASVVVDTCAAVEKFFDSQQRFPKRQNPDTDERRAEDALAQRWDRLLVQRASLEDALLSTYERLFLAADMEDASVVVDTCAAVEKFFDSQQRFPKRQNPDTDERRAEDALAQRWDRLLVQRASLPNEIQERHRDLFDSADMADTDAIFALCLSVQHFFNSAGRLPRRQTVNDQQQHEEDRLARRWHRLLERHDWLQVVKSPQLEVELLQVVQSPQSEELRRMLTDLLTVQHREDVLRGRVSPHTCVDNLL